MVIGDRMISISSDIICRSKHFSVFSVFQGDLQIHAAGTGTAAVAAFFKNHTVIVDLLTFFWCAKFHPADRSKNKNQNSKNDSQSLF